jgi:hypothetical protein
MVRLNVATVLLAVTAVARAVTPDTPSIVPGAYIVEYEEDQVGSCQRLFMSRAPY